MISPTRQKKIRDVISVRVALEEQHAYHFKDEFIAISAIAVVTCFFGGSK
jgi:hypothetical protein